VFAVIAPWMFVANLPSLVRCGPEGHKGLAVDGFLIPMVALGLSCRAGGAKKKPNKHVPRNTESTWLARAG